MFESYSYPISIFVQSACILESIEYMGIFPVSEKKLNVDLKLFASYKVVEAIDSTSKLFTVVPVYPKNKYILLYL